MDKPSLFEASAPSARPAVYDPVTLMAAVSQHTRHIGFVGTGSTTYESPWVLARRYASLDHVSNGRAAWNVVTGSNPGDSKNSGIEKHPARDERYARAEEVVSACEALWDSWDEDAFVQDKQTGKYLDSSKVWTPNFEGEYLSARGPLNVARTPQGRPILFHAGQSEGGRQLAAKHADCLFEAAASVEAAREFYSDMKQRRSDLGGNPDHLRILRSVAIYLGRSEEEATSLYDELNSLITPDYGVEFLGKAISEDLSGYPVDGPVPDLSGSVVGGNSIRGQLDAIAKAERLTIRQLYERVVPTMGNTALIGTATQIADVMNTGTRPERATDSPLAPRSALSRCVSSATNSYRAAAPWTLPQGVHGHDASRKPRDTPDPEHPFCTLRFRPVRARIRLARSLTVRPRSPTTSPPITEREPMSARKTKTGPFRGGHF